MGKDLKREQTEARWVEHLSMAGQTGHAAQYRSDFSQIFFSGIFQILIITQHIGRGDRTQPKPRSEAHTSELQSRGHLVCRLLLETKNREVARQPRGGGGN